MLLASLIIAAAAYLLGSIPTGYLLVRLFRHQDIRSVGSGNIGATNVLRSGGKGLGAATFLLDMLKGCAAVWLGGVLGALLLPATPAPAHAQALAALFAVLGHMFPVWLRFRGGKGVATGFGVFLVAAPWAALAAISVFFIVLLPHPLRFAGLHPRRRQLSRLCLVLHRIKRSPPTTVLHRRRVRRRPAHHRQTSPEHPPPAGRHGIPLRSQENRMSRIVVLGSGAWGTAIALSLSRRGGHQITLWSHSNEEARQIAERRRKHALPPRLSPARRHRRHRRRRRRHRCRDRRLRHPLGVPAPHPRPPSPSHAPRPDHRLRHQGR